MASITLYQFHGDIGIESASPFCVKVHRLLGFKGLAYRLHNVSSPGELRRINPGASKLPVIDYDGELVVDSSRIFRLVERNHPDPPLWPAGVEARAFGHLLEDWADEALYWFVVYHRWAVDANFRPFARRAFGKMAPPLRWLVPAMVRRTVRRQLHGQGTGRLSADAVRENLEEHLVALDGLLAKRAFLAADRLTGADIAVFAPLRVMAVASFPETAQMISRHAPLMDWIRRVDQATASEHTVALP